MSIIALSAFKGSKPETSNIIIAVAFLSEYEGLRMKALIVDDQRVSRMKVQKIMEGFCEIDAADCGQAAIEAFKKSLDTGILYDLVTLDVSMPDMDGRQVLQIIRKLELEKGIHSEKQVKVLMITSSSDKETVVSSIQAGCDDYLIKPLNRETISSKLEKFGLIVPQESRSEATVRQMVATAIERFKQGELDLPAMPQIVREIQKTIDSSESSIFAVAAIIERDVSIAVKLIATANSPHYRGFDKIQSVHAAISRLGLKEIQEMVTAIANRSLYDTKNKQLKQLLDKLWLHSLACAHGAKLIAANVPQIDGEKAFMGGLIHDIGCVLLLKSLGDNVSSTAALDQEELVASVYEVHTNFGAALLDKWKFSKDFIRICKLHEWTDFSANTEKEVLIVNLADHLAHTIDYGFFSKDSIELADLSSFNMLQLDSETIETLCREVEGIMKDSANVF